ncbi:LysR substrate-binding domain-containing protein [Streptomyces sp. NPDC048483]|uniref:LysR substrate-binding domain-containing protein n=1 Tax=Streptomyces sp. NPDC048483 TaxID=3154927 RepID=UPI00341657FA
MPDGVADQLADDEFGGHDQVRQAPPGEPIADQGACAARRGRAAPAPGRPPSRLLGGELDLLLIESWANRPLAVPEGVTLRTVVSEEVYVAVSEGHPLADRGAADLAGLAVTAWACCPPGTEPYEALVQALRARGIEPDIRYSVAEHLTQLALVARGLTAALIPAMSRHPAPPGVRFLPARPALRRDIRAAWLTRTQSPPVRACLAAIGT